uniref:Uncharacterized protein n=1 Tax=viral metagenome TaxID=1070528 RepID=A0A6C0E9M4_9ZZZZ
MSNFKKLKKVFTKELQKYVLLLKCCKKHKSTEKPAA